MVSPVRVAYSPRRRGFLLIVVAWILGGSDPNSGTATQYELIRGLGKLLRKGWKPLRTIVLASWDAEEYGLIGSTEWAEDFGEWISNNSALTSLSSWKRSIASPLLPLPTDGPIPVDWCDVIDPRSRRVLQPRLVRVGQQLWRRRFSCE